MLDSIQYFLGVVQPPIRDYSDATIGLWLLMIGMVLWTPVYIIVVRNIFKHKFVEMPVFAGCAAVAWEFLWGFIFSTDFIVWNLALATWMYRVAFILDVVIFYGVLKYGHLQVSIPSLPQINRHYKPICWVLMLTWVAFWFFFGKQYDPPLGTTSGFMITLAMSACYVIVIIKQPYENARKFSLTAGWCKLAGTGMVTLSMLQIYPDNHLVTMMGITIFILDSIYIYVLTGKLKAPEAALQG